MPGALLVPGFNSIANMNTVYSRGMAYTHLGNRRSMGSMLSVLNGGAELGRPTGDRTLASGCYTGGRIVIVHGRRGECEVGDSFKVRQERTFAFQRVTSPNGFERRNGQPCIPYERVKLEDIFTSAPLKSMLALQRYEI